MGEARKKLAEEVGTAPWSLLDPHFRRDALFLVDPQLELLDVAVAAAEDRTAEVRGWIEEGRLSRPSAEQSQAWADEEGAMFRFVIVQPFVLAQRIASPDADASS